MKVERLPEGFVVRSGYRYFHFFVDSDSSAWSKHIWNARKHPTQADAEQTLTELRRRAKERRKSRRSQ